MSVILLAPQSFAFERAGNIATKYNLSKHVIYLHGKKKYLAKLEDVRINTEIRPLLEKHKFEEARALANKYNVCSHDKYQYYFNYHHSLNDLELLLKSWDFDGAQCKYKSIDRTLIPESTFENLLNVYKDKYFSQELELLLKRFRFKDADELFRRSHWISKEKYISKKAKQIELYTKSTLGIKNSLDDQQSQALADISDNLLVTARAGSGKTTVLTCKGMFLAGCKYVNDPDSILMLAFNRKAADEIRERINIRHNIPLKNIRTFHSLAHRIVQPQQEIKEKYEDEMAIYLKNLLKDYPRLKEYLYDFFKKEMEDIDYMGLLLDETDYYDHAKHYWQSISLGGDRVRSFGEKCIADFLFEHGLTYKYEKPYLIVAGKKQIYKPDFAIYESYSRKTFILEHWAIPDKDYYTDRKIWNRSDKTERQYADERVIKRDYWKKEYWKRKQYFLIETDVRWLENGRDEFEKKLKDLLESNGVVCEKLLEEALLEKVYTNHSNKLFRLFVSFIQRCRKNGYTPESIKEKRAKYKTDNEKENVFLKVAPEIYEKYENSLIKKEELDFDKLINDAVEKIRSSRGDCYIVDKKHNVNIKVKDLKYILIDEFQDFSKQFFDIVTAIKEINPDLKLFCVGDDWQAINSFAGSDLKYFQEFENNYAVASKRHILINYRSYSKIVYAGNNLMDGDGEKSQPSPSNSGGTVEVINIEDYDIEGRKNQAGEEQYRNDTKYIKACEIKIPTKDGDEWTFADYDTARYIKAIHIMLQENIELISQKNKKCFVLTRGNSFGCFPSSNCLKEKILEVILDKEKDNIGGKDRLREKIHVMTAHKSKGKEADIVFVLKCNMYNFPMIHPDNRLFGIFGITEEKVLAEEKRLFYVALTRAKQKVFLLTEEEDISPFLQKIDAI